MAEFILPLVKSILLNLAGTYVTDAGTYVTDEIKVALAAKNDLGIIKDNFTAICAILQDAEEKQYANNAMQLWLKDLKSVAYDVDDLLDELAYDALLRSVNKGHLWLQTRYYLSTSNPILSRFDLGHKIKALRQQLVLIVSKKNDFNLTERPIETPKVQRNPLDSCAYVKTSAIVGRDEAKEDVIKRLMSLDDISSLTVLPVVGMGGIGKTALAKLVYHDILGFDIKLWACVSDEFDIEKILAEIIKNHSDHNTSNISLERSVGKLANLLKGKKYYIVLDDVWVDDIAKWTDLKDLLDIGKPGSVILITTRNQKVANITRTIDPYNLDKLPDSVCWSIFQQLAFMKGEEQKFPKLCEIGKSIVQKCRGVPLVVKALGSLLRMERGEEKWLEITNMDNFMQLHRQYDDVMQLLKLSYIKLPSHLKTCFSYLAISGKDHIYQVRHLKAIMRALGPTLLGDGDSKIQSCEENYCVELLLRSMIQDTVMSLTGNLLKFKMHDLLHDVAVDVLGEELTVVTKNELKVSESTRHVTWQQFLSDNEYPEKLFKARKARTFKVATKWNLVSQSFLEKIISNYSRLRVLEIQDSFIEKLPSSIGNLKHLRLLKLSGNSIRSLPDTICELLNLQTMYLNGCLQLEELPKRIHRLINLRYFSVTTRQTSLVGTQFSGLPCVDHLFLVSCKRLTSLWESHNVGHLASLRVLCIENCPKLTSLPNSMKLLVALEELWIRNCRELDLEDGDGLSDLQSLRYLEISEMPQMTRLPNAILSAAMSLRYMWIEKCGGLLELPKWLQSFSSLQKLRIGDCLHLSKRCAVPVGEDYPLIRHVSEFKLDGRMFPTNQK